MTETVAAIPVERARVYLEALRFGCVRLMEITSSVLVRTRSTQHKLDLSIPDRAIEVAYRLGDCGAQCAVHRAAKVAGPGLRGG